METVMVINDATLFCGCRKSDNCKCKTAKPSQGKTSYLLRNEGTPEPLPPNVWNFSDDQEEQPVSTSAVMNKSTGGGLPQTDWDAIFNQTRPVVKPVTKPVTKPPVKNEATHVPLGLPVWNW